MSAPGQPQAPAPAPSAAASGEGAPSAGRAGTGPVPTPSQTAGPFLAIGLTPLEHRELVPTSHPGAVALQGRVLDGAGEGVPDGAVELWSPPATPASDASGWPAGLARCLTGPGGEFSFVVAKPGGAAPADPGNARDGAGVAAGGGGGAPHLEVHVVARGLLASLRTRIYFPDEEAANGTDPVLAALDGGRRATLVARAEGGGLRFDICLQGAGETVFFGA